MPDLIARGGRSPPGPRGGAGGAATFRDVHRSPFRQHFTSSAPPGRWQSPPALPGEAPCPALPCLQPRVGAWGARGRGRLPVGASHAGEAQLWPERRRGYAVLLPQFPHLLWWAQACAGASGEEGMPHSRPHTAGAAAWAPSPLLCPILSLLEPCSGLGCRGGGSFLFAQDRRGWGGPIPSL